MAFCDFINEDPSGEARTRVSLKNRLLSIRDFTENQYDGCIKLIWQNRHDLTPQEVFDIAGNHAVEMMLYLQTIRQWLVSAGASPLPLKPPTETWTGNPDGTITVG